VHAPSDVGRAESAPARAPDVERALRPGRPRWLVGCASRPPVHAGQATHRVSWATKAVVGLGPVLISAWWLGNSKNSFSIFLSVSN
jgi:hypothetical protein